MLRLIGTGFIVIMVVIIVLVGIATDKLGDIIGGLLVTGVICTALGVVGVFLFRVFALSANERDKTRLSHAREMLQKGIVPKGRGFPEYIPAPIPPPVTLPPAPVPAALPDPTKGVHFTDSNLETNVVNLLLYSKQLLGDDSNRIASGPECAAANIPGYNARKWSSMIHDYLEPNFEVATVRGPVDNGGGVFVPESIGTVGKLYDRIVYNNAMGALPTTFK